MILAGDIGGTKVVLALYEESGGAVTMRREQTFASREHATFDEVLAAFLGDPRAPLRGACIAVAGPVIDGRCETTNLPWVLDEKELAERLHVPRVKLLNDIEGAAIGMLTLPPNELCALNRGAGRRDRNAGVISTGTGLGEAILYWDGTAHHPIASEGGHGDFAPHSDQEIELLRYLRAREGGHVSYERVVSGPGIANVYGFLRDSGYAAEPEWLRQEIAAGDPAAVISQHALSGEPPLCRAALDLFCAALGAEAGNLALRAVATAGVFVGGGIPPKILPLLQSGSFMRAFVAKGRFESLLRDVSVDVVLNPRTPLLGAAHFALRLTGAGHA